LHDQPLTPLQRLLHSKEIPRAKKAELRELVAPLNPFELQRAMKSKINKIHQFRFLKSSTKKQQDKTTIASSATNAICSPVPVSLHQPSSLLFTKGLTPSC
ncbi:MAG: hypothetical protein HY960_02475, partial [Ignavibacteriae bacterium]|nr:hypothetical protein [Ignavibacteriota bacterium]